jgi:hydroxypyruvate isomerase
MRVSLCLEMIYTGLAWTARLERAAALGVPAVEFWDWRNKPLEEMAAAARANGVEIAAFSANREFAPVDAREHDGLEREVAGSLAVAARLRCPSLMLLSDTLDARGGSRQAGNGHSAAEKRAALVAALCRLGPLAARHGVTLLLEPLNTRLDHPGYSLDNSAAACEVLEEAAHPALKLLYDVYHMRTMGEDFAAAIPACATRLGHIHAAGVPGRGALDAGYASVAGVLRQAGYRGYVGLEFAPTGDPGPAVRAALKLFSQPASS